MRLQNFTAVPGIALMTTIVVAVASIGGCTKNHDPNTADYWINRLDDRNQRVEALINLGRLGDTKAIPEVRQWFREPGPWLPEAAYALGQLGDQEIVPELVKNLDFNVGIPSNTALRQKSRINISIIQALALLQARPQAAEISKMMATSDDRVKETCLTALGDLGDFANTATIINAALTESSPFVRLAAIRALGTLADPAAVPTLINLLFVEVGDAHFYEPAQYALLQIGPSAVAELINTLQRKNKTIEQLDNNGSKLAEGTIEARCASVLGSLRDPNSAPAIKQALNRLYAQVQSFAGSEPPMAYYAVIELAYALGAVGGEGAAAALTRLATANDAELRLAACEALTTLGDRSVVPDLLAASRTGPPAARRATLLAASRLGTAAHLSAFTTVADANNEKENADLSELQSIVDQERARLVAAAACNSNTSCWQEKIDDPNPKIREKAAYELGWLKDRTAIAHLLKAAEDDNAQVRIAAVLSINQLIGTADIPVESLQKIYDKWHKKVEYAGVSDELLRVIARAKNTHAAKKAQQ
jgi:HEAT repeat protein